MAKKCIVLVQKLLLVIIVLENVSFRCLFAAYYHGYDDHMYEFENCNDCNNPRCGCYYDYGYPEYVDYRSPIQEVDPVVAVTDPIPAFAKPLVTVVNSDYCNNCYDPDCDCYYDYGYPGYWDYFPLRTRRYEYDSRYGYFEAPRYAGYRYKGRHRYWPLDRRFYRLDERYGNRRGGEQYGYRVFDR